MSFAIADASQVSAARLGVQRMARELEFEDVRAGRVAIGITEAATNMLKHASGGTVIARRMARNGCIGIEVVAVDSGPGMESFESSARDGESTAGTPGTGLGAMRRLSDGFEVYTRPGSGTALRMMFWDRDAPARGARPHAADYDEGAVFVPKPGETACGDAWGMQAHDAGATFVISDGLGHGIEANEASMAAVDVLRRNPSLSAVRLIDLAHARLRATRGAAVAVMRHEAGSGELAFAAVGNISACILDGEARRTLLTHNGIVGHQVHKAEEYRYPWPARGLLVAHTDGIASRWSLDPFPGLAACHPSLIAAVLFREHSRKRDDVGILVVRMHAPGGR